MTTEHLFVYGSLMEPAVQKRIFGHLVTGVADTLDGYDRRWLHLTDGTFPIIFAAPGHSVGGLVLELSPEELMRGDQYESDDYRRVRVTLRSGRETWVYLE